MKAGISRRTTMQMALAPLAMAVARAADLPPTVSMVYPDVDGRLAYAPDQQGNAIPDFSHAGYGGGGTPIPSVHVKETVWPTVGATGANEKEAVRPVELRV